MDRALAKVLNERRLARRDAGFQDVLMRLARTGTAVGAGLGIIAVLLFVGIHLALLGKTLGWSYDEGILPMWDKTVLIGLCAMALAVAGRLSLNGVRLLAAGVAIACALASVADDIVGGAPRPPRCSSRSSSCSRSCPCRTGRCKRRVWPWLSRLRSTSPSNSSRMWPTCRQ